MEVWRSYPYLWQEVMWAAVVAGWLFWRVPMPLRRRIAQASLLFTFNIPSAVFFQPDYWNPRRLGGWPFGLEDFLFSFSASATVLLIHVRWTPPGARPGPSACRPGGSSPGACPATPSSSPSVSPPVRA